MEIEKVWNSGKYDNQTRTTIADATSIHGKILRESGNTLEFNARHIILYAYFILGLLIFTSEFYYLSDIINAVGTQKKYFEYQHEC